MLNQVMNADFHIQKEEMITDMCYAVEKIKEGAAVTAVITALREMDISDSTIVEKIMKQFQLTVDEAKSYMSMTTA